MSEREQIELPPLSTERIAEIERRVIDEIGVHRIIAPRRRRRRVWLTTLGVAAAFAAGIMIAPGVISGIRGGTGASDSSAVTEAGREPGGFVGVPGTAGGAEGDGAGGDDAAGAASAEGGAVATDEGKGSASIPEGREIITTAQVQLQVADVSKAADDLARLAAAHGGYVQSSDIGASDKAATAEPAPPANPGTGWISIRVAATDLEEVLRALSDDGQVLRSAISRQDVTSTAVDLRARIDAARASVKRLTELMAKSGSVADLIAAESALSERQAQLESYEQELKSLDEQVDLSTVTVQLSEPTTATQAEPGGFLDGLLSGWNGLIAALNGLVIGFGFLLPWLAVAGVILLIVWLIRRRRHRPARTDTAENP